jgi:hypothetical protein
MPLRLEITLPPQIALDLDPRKVRAVLRSAGSEIAALARRRVRQSTGTGKTYYGAEKGKHRASLPGQPPASWTGQLASSISTRVFGGGDGVLIRDTAFYARFLETGAKGGIGSGRKGAKGGRNARQRRSATVLPVGKRVLLPRPFLSAAYDERKDSIGERVQRAIIDGTKFRRIGAATKITL